MKRGEVFAASFLAAGFAFVTFTFVVLEPRMGFTELADFFDPTKVFAAARTAAWIVEDVVYFGCGVALVHLGLSSDDRYARTSGIVAGVCLFVVGCMGRVIGGLPDLVADAGQRNAAVLGILSARLAVLRTTVFAAGVLAWRTSLQSVARGGVAIAWRGLGVLMLVGCTVFLFVFVPVPLLITAWAAWLAVRLARAGEG